MSNGSPNHERREVKLTMAKSSLAKIIEDDGRSAESTRPASEGEVLPFPLRFAEKPSGTTLPPGMTALCATVYTTVDTTGEYEDPHSDED